MCIRDRHMAVREKAGLFDVSHMGELRLKGPDAVANVQKIITADISNMKDGEIKYSMFCNDNGGIIDDFIVYRCAADNYWLVVNAGNREKDAAYGRTTFHIAIMPCTAKKMEAGREEFRRDGVPNVDLVLTTQEVIKMIKESGIRFQMLEKESPDLPFGMGSGAAEIFGTSGGVAEAVLRCCLPDKSKNVLRMLEHSGLRGTEAVRFVTIPVNGRDVRVALAHGLALSLIHI